MSLNSYISGLTTEKWFSFTDTPPTAGTIVNQGGNVSNITLRTSTSASTPTLISDGSGPDGSNFWRFSTTAASTAVTESTTGGFTALANTMDTDWVVGQWVRFNSLPTSANEAAIGFLSWNTYSAGGFRLSLNGNTTTNPYRIRMALTSSITVYSTDPVFSGIWYFISVQRSGNTYTLYINGEAQGSATGSTPITANNFIWGATSQPDTGLTFDLSWFVAAPTASLTPAVMQNIVAERTYDKFKARIWDLDRTPIMYVPFDSKNAAGNFRTANTIDNRFFTGSEATVVTGENAKIGQGAAQINASGTLGGGSINPPLDANFTISTWFKRNGAPSDNFTNWFYWYSSSAYRIDSGKANIRTTGQLHFDPVINNTSGTALYTQVNVCDNIWHHIVITKSGATMKIFVDGQLKQTATNWPSVGIGTPSSFTLGGSVGTALTSFDETFILDSALSDTAVASLYSTSISSVDITYANTSGATASATFPDATHTAETVINVTYTSDVLGTASAEITDPMVGVGIDLDGGGVLTADALAVDPTITTTSNIDYSASTFTASATSPNANVAAQRFISYSASPATASALLSSNVFYGESLQDTSYNLHIREINSASSINSDGNNGFEIGTQSSGVPDNIDARQAVVIKPTTGFPIYNKIVKARINPAHVTATQVGDVTNGNTFNVYVLTADPTSNTFTTAPYSSFTPVREYLYTTRYQDDGSLGQQYLDLTPAFADSRSATYGIMIEHVHTETSGSGTIYDRTEYTGSNLQNQLLYVLTSDIVNKNINADIITASALATDATIDAQKYVTLSVDSSTASADSVTPDVGLSVGFNADPSTASVEVIQPTFARTVEFSHEHFEAFAAPVHPQVFAFGTITYAATVATASALFHMPQANIGENNIVDHMNASAIFVEPMLLLSRSVAAMTTTASTLMVDPTVNAQLLGAVIATPMRANVMSPNPPAYTNLLSDEWYAALYAQHSVQVVGFPSGSSSAFLKLYEDQNTDITQFTPNTSIDGGRRSLRQVFNNLTQTITTNGAVVNDTPNFPANVITDYSTPENESRLSVGYFDPYGRKAVRLQNIGIRMANPYSYVRADFSLEFSIKTTKADQVLAYGEWSSQYGPGRARGLYNLVDGKINTFTYNDYRIIHPKEIYGGTVVSGSGVHGITGYKRIDDGQWHHVIIQYRQGSADDQDQQGRYQVWIDGELDIQRFGAYLYEPEIFGANTENGTYAPDFYTSATSLDAPGFISERDIDLHYFDYIKYEPIFAEPMTASLTMTQGNSAKGNRKRALMLYWWPSNTGQNKNLIFRQFDSGRVDSSSFPDVPMFDYNLDTIDYIKQPPQQYYGWDIFPVDINGYYVSDLVKEEAYGGEQNIVLNDVGGVVGPFDGPRPQFKTNRAGWFRNTKDDTRRYIDLVNDIDLSQFDAIFFKNYPDQTREQESFSKNEIVDSYFNIRENVIFENFIKSLRAAVDTGISLMVNNPQLALDLKIVNRIELVPDLNDVTGYQSDPYSPTIVPGAAGSLPINTGNTANAWFDSFRNNRIRVLNTIPGLTDWRSVIHTKMAMWKNDDTIDFGGASREFHDYELKPNGLSVGDEFFLNTTSYDPFTVFGSLVAATPINNILCGTPITAFANQYRRGLELVDNPYKNHVTSIAIKPGDVLNGKQVGGKIWVNFTEPIPFENEEITVDAIHTEWIEAAYFDGTITLAERNSLIASINCLETRLNQGIITQAEYNDLSGWASNGMYLLAQSREIEAGDPGRSDFGGEQARRGTVRKTSRTGVTSTSPVSFNQQWFLFTYSKQYRQLFFDLISMNTRGFRWISDRVEEVGQTQAHTAMPASATMIEPVVVGEKSNNITVQPMLANAIKVAAVGFAGVDRNIISLPLEASARITEPVKRIPADPMTVSAAFREQVVIRTTAQDQVVVYVLHEDPILYLREDIIK